MFFMQTLPEGCLNKLKALKIQDYGRSTAPEWQALFGQFIEGLDYLEELNVA